MDCTDQIMRGREYLGVIHYRYVERSCSPRVVVGYGLSVQVGGSVRFGKWAKCTFLGVELPTTTTLARELGKEGREHYAHPDGETLELKRLSSCMAFTLRFHDLSS